MPKTLRFKIEELFPLGIAALTSVLLAGGALLFLISGKSRFLLAFFILLLNSFMGLFVLFQNWRSRLNQVFCLLTFCVALWSCSVAVFQVTGSMLWGRLAYAFAPFIPPIFLSFVRMFPKYEEKADFSDIFIYILGLALCGMAFTDLVIREVVELSWGFTLRLGPLYWLFAFYFVGVILYDFTKLFLKYRRTWASAGPR